ncbi:mechanosensitive ion channel family protein [Calothrix rhizosoleniae]|uniref:mechanosensitive ion channel family protein n=1 Tax=Calothrix rhizosoleniae TaxID=888997 RepID=UPI000B4A051D|nr:mechanosensitive ion channel domain-containing protein [Calothrix rhizosoleniae]
MLKYHRSIRTNYRQFFQVAIIALALICGLLITSAQGQSQQSAAVVVDGRQIFRVSQTEEFAAQRRAKDVNYQLKAVIKSGEVPQVEILEKNNSPTIWINGNYLLTVTEKDTFSNKTPKALAVTWVNKIRTVVKKAQQERDVNFVRNTSLLSVAIIFMAFFLHRSLGILWQIIQEYCSRILHSEAPSRDHNIKTLNFLLKATLVLVRLSLWVGSILYITDLFPVTRYWSYRIRTTIITSLTSPILTNTYSLIDILILVGLLLGLIIISGSATNLLRSRVLRALGISLGIQEVIAVICKYALIAVGSVILLQVWGVDLSSLAILASALGVGIGFGFQDIAKNFGSGIVLLFERPIQVGDFVEVGQYMGTVEHIGARSVFIRTLDRVSIIVPNSRFLETEVINWSHQNPISRIHIPVGVAYGSDIEKVKIALLDAADAHSDVLKFPLPQVLFQEFGDSALNFELLVWINKPNDQPTIKSDINFLIAASLEQHHIEIPFPQQDLHVRSGDLPIKLSHTLEQALLHLSQKLNGTFINKDNRNDN